MEINQTSGDQSVRGAWMEINQGNGDKSLWHHNGTHYDITMCNGIAMDTHCDIKMGNAVTREIHCDVTMSNDVAMCAYHGIIMHNEIAMNVFYYDLICLFMIFSDLWNIPTHKQLLCSPQTDQTLTCSCYNVFTQSRTDVFLLCVILVIVIALKYYITYERFKLNIVPYVIFRVP